MEKDSRKDAPVRLNGRGLTGGISQGIQDPTVVPGAEIRGNVQSPCWICVWVRHGLQKVGLEIKATEACLCLPKIKIACFLIAQAKDERVG